MSALAFAPKTFSTWNDYQWQARLNFAPVLLASGRFTCKRPQMRLNDKKHATEAANSKDLQCSGRNQLSLLLRIPYIQVPRVGIRVEQIRGTFVPRRNIKLSYFVGALSNAFTNNVHPWHYVLRRICYLCHTILLVYWYPSCQTRE